MKVNKSLLRLIAVGLTVIAVLWLYHTMRGWLSTVSRDTVSPYGRFAVSASDFLASSAEFLGSRANLVSENEALREEVAELRLRHMVLSKLEREHEELREAFRLGYASPEFVCAEVVSRGGISGWWKQIRINKGIADGVRRNCTVVNTDGLVGRVVSVSEHTADVLLLTDVNSKVACQVEGLEADARGIMVGTGVSSEGNTLDLLHVVEPMSLTYLEKDCELDAGRQVETSGIGGLYPAGVPVGEVIDVRMDSTLLFQRATVRPYVDFGSLNRVYVMLGRSPKVSVEEDAHD